MSATRVAPKATEAPPIPAPSSRLVTVLFGATILVGSALLFLVEPMVAKMLLPLLGGVPAVWNTALVFFQVALLAGYAFTHLASIRLRLRTLVIAQALLFVVAAATLPVSIPGDWIPDTSIPAQWALLALVVAVGLPFFALATVSPMLQRWYSHTTQGDSHDPYFLYAASNLGSLIGLAGYPLVLEPAFDLGDQARVWAYGFVALVALISATGLVTLRRRREEADLRTVAPTPATDESGGPSDPEAQVAVESRLRQRLRWVALAAIPSALLLGVTHHLTTDIASFPLLWVIPLSIYLGTFIVAFGSNPPWLRKVAGYVLKLLAIPLALTLFGVVPLGYDLALSLTIFTAAALLAHGELAASRPSVDRLTEFYLLVSVGGAIGGMLTALVAPLVFPIVLEYPLAIAFSLTVLPAAVFANGATMSRTAQVVVVAAVFGAAIALVLALAADEAAVAMALAAAAGIAVYVTAKRPSHFAVGIGLILLLVPIYSVLDTIHVDRSFFGTVEIQDVGGFRIVTSGSTAHGAQSLDPAAASEPVTYYHRTGPVGDLFRLTQGEGSQDVAVVGLGAGGIATYGRPGDHYVFLEIDPLIAAVAENPVYFTYLQDSPADIDVRLGDGRLLLESTTEQYDLIFLDAFTSDAIPIHLLTLEAMSSYLEHLAPDGVIAYNVSNRHVDIRPVLARQAEELGLAVRGIQDRATADEASTGKWSSDWVVVARDDSTLEGLGDRWTPIDHSGAPLWTDSYSNLLQVLELW